LRSLGSSRRYVRAFRLYATLVVNPIVLLGVQPVAIPRKADFGNQPPDARWGLSL